jgi:L-amino acid N-acyltransferase YncA
MATPEWTLPHRKAKKNITQPSIANKKNTTQPSTANGRKKKSSPWISDRELKKMTANAALPPTTDPETYDHGDTVDPHLFTSWGGERTIQPNWDDRLAYQNRDLNGTVREWQKGVIVQPKPLGKILDQYSYTMPDFVGKQTTNLAFWVGRHHAPANHLFFLPPLHDQTLMVELVPRAWIPSVFEPGHNVKSFWQQQIRDDPQPLDASDFDNFPPFWDRYVVDNAAIQLFPAQPDHLGYNPSEESPRHVEARTVDEGSQGWTNQYLENPDAFMMARFGRKATLRRGKQHGDERPKPLPSFIDETPIIDSTIRPLVNVFVRMAELGDIPQMTEIYNHYVKNSVCTPELEPVSITNMKARWESTRNAHLPWLVCCSLNSCGGHKGKHARPSVDTVLGFAFADDLCGSSTMVRFSVELGLYVSASPKYRRKGVSKCLMDKMLVLLDQYYLQRGGYEMDEQLGIGPRRLVSRIMFNMMNSETDMTKEWMVPYIESWGFKQKATLNGFGYKLSKV